MANFLVNTPSSEVSGTLTADLFVLSTASEVTVFGLDGKDTITATVDATNSATKLNAGKGADTINYSGNQIVNGASIYGAAGHDTLNISNDLQSSNVRGGQGNDTIAYVGSATNVTINGNDLADQITATFDEGSHTSLVAGGKGKDTIGLNFATGGFEVSVNGGAGHDTVNISAAALGSISSMVLLGGKGNDTITFGDNAAAGLSGQFNIDGGDQADLITIGSASDIVSDATSTIQGGAGADTIVLSGDYKNSAGLIDGGAGADSINLQSAGAGTIQGGAGLDSITLGVYASASGVTTTNLGYLVGGSEADTFSLGSGSVSNAVTGTIGLNNGSILRYDSFGDSTLSNLDTVSANVSVSTVTGSYDANLFKLSQSLVTFSAAGGANNQFTGTNGVATFTSTFSESVTARVASLDTQVAKGTVAYFEADSGDTDYLFVQGGAQNGGTSDDLVIKLNTAAHKITAYSNSSIGVVKTATV